MAFLFPVALLLFAAGFSNGFAKEGGCDSDFHKLVRRIRGEQNAKLNAPHPSITWDPQTNLSATQKEEILSTLRETDRLLNGFFEAPAHLTIEGHPQHDDPSSSEFPGAGKPMNYLTLGYQDELVYRSPNAPASRTTSNRPVGPGTRTGTKHAKYSRATWIHEYAHVYSGHGFRSYRGEGLQKIRQQYLSKHPEIARKLSEHEALTRRYLELLGERFRLQDQVPRDTAALDKLEAELRPVEEAATEGALLKEDIDKLLKPTIRAFDHSITALYELFSDTVAVVQVGDPDAMAKAFNSAGASDKGETFKSRRYSRRHQKQYPLSDYHYALQSLRFEVGRKMKPYLQTPEKKAEFLRAFSETLQKVFESVAANQTDAPITVEGLKHLTLSALEETFGR